MYLYPCKLCMHCLTKAKTDGSKYQVYTYTAKILMFPRENNNIFDMCMYKTFMRLCNTNMAETQKRVKYHQIKSMV